MTPPVTSNLARVICTDPPIVLGTTALETLPIGPAPLLSPALAGRRAWFPTRVGWQVETETKRREVVEAYRHHVAAFPGMLDDLFPSQTIAALAEQLMAGTR